MNLPILYSFRRCPYAIRARLAIAHAGVRVALREVVLKDKPASMLESSNKGTVPVLVLCDEKSDDIEVIDESWDIMRWALAQSTADTWLPYSDHDWQSAEDLRNWNDVEFKPLLDRYKYADRHPERSLEAYRKEAFDALRVLEERLTQHEALLGDNQTLIDYAIFPFVRQFAAVDLQWFAKTDCYALQAWLGKHLASALFAQVMLKYPKWVEGVGEGEDFP